MSWVEGTEVWGSLGVIATGPAEGARVGARLFAQGGNAFDAAAAACLACAVTEPQAVDIGGYVFAAVVLDGKTDQVWSIDANSISSAAAREDMFEVTPLEPGKRGINEIEYGCSVRGDANVYGPLSVGVPGFVAGVGSMWERWGRTNWANVVEPARELIENGLSYDLVRPAVEMKRDAIARFPYSAQVLFDETWCRDDLARTLDRLASAGWRDFYGGELGRIIADFVSGQGGVLTREDMTTFSPRITEPCTGAYRNAIVHTAIAPNGGFSVLEALRAIETSPMPHDADVAYWERLIQVLPEVWRRRLDAPATGAIPHGTVHVAAADGEGNLVSATISQGGLFGSCLAVPRTGIILGHGMCRFDPHRGLPNSPGPRKRPLNNVCPLIIRLPDREVAIGARGGRRIVSVAPQFVQRIVDFGASVYQAVAAPRLHTLSGDPVEISHNFDPGIRDALSAAGHTIEVPNEVAGAAHGAEILKGTGQLRAGGNTWAAGL